ncbi:MAG: dihydrofolate synthase / folylpolyglutamate synthase [Hyphomonadaceae bacterium]|nr:MAG: dihydrofolate synthase / folylpolyglutamate synthase [Hyphomonadaceae bacterium]
MKKPAEITAAEIFYAFPRVIDLSLDRIRAALKPLDLVLPPIIHIAGTNGKGSTLAFLRSILEAAGKTCHVYTSPHLVTIHERYVIAGKQISEEALLKYAKIVQEIAKGIPLTIFEAETLAGFLAFADTPADYLLLETGLGGRLDATNAIDQKLLTIITPIDYDHKEFLGEDLAQIAREKCGILRAKTPAIIARQREEIVDVIEHEIEIIGAIPLVFGQEWDSYQSYGKLCLQTENQLIELPPPSLHGAHQFENAGTAARAALALGIEEAAIARGLQSAKWPARMQRFDFGEYGSMAISVGAELWLDGGHNPHGARAAANFMAQLQDKNPRPFVLICGLLGNKDLEGFFEAFKQLSPKIMCVPITSSPNGTAPEALAKTAQSMGFDAIAFEDFELALTAALQFATTPRVLICGSLYLAGSVLADNSKLVSTRS